MERIADQEKSQRRGRETPRPPPAGRPAGGESLNALTGRARGMGVDRHVVRVGLDTVTLWARAGDEGAPRAPKAPPLILMHGASYSSQSVFNLPYLSLDGAPYSLMDGLGRFGVATYANDLSGYGASPPRAGGGDVDLYVRELDAVVDFVAARERCRPVVVGWSWGGEVAGRFAAHRPHKISGLVLWGTPWCGPGSDLRLGRPASYDPSEDRRINTAEHARADFRTPDFYEDGIIDAFAEHALRVDGTAPNICVRALLGAMPIVRPERITVPTMLLYGERDPVFESSDPAGLHEALAATEKTLVVIPRSDHNTQFCMNRSRLWSELRAFSDAVGGAL